MSSSNFVQTYGAINDKSGSVTLTNLRPGKYTLNGQSVIVHNVHHNYHNYHNCIHHSVFYNFIHQNFFMLTTFLMLLAGILYILINHKVLFNNIEYKIFKNDKILNNIINFFIIIIFFSLFIFNNWPLTISLIKNIFTSCNNIVSSVLMGKTASYIPINNLHLIFMFLEMIIGILIFRIHNFYLDNNIELKSISKKLVKNN